jgi:hypothetical protein
MVLAALPLLLLAHQSQLFPDPVPGVEHAVECLTGKIVEADPICDDGPAAVSRRLPSMPSGGRAGFAAVTIGPSLIAVGGRDDESNGGIIRGGVSAVEALDLNTREWSPLPDLKNPRAELAAVAVGCIVVVLGGLNNTGGPVAAVEALDLSKNRWPWQNPDPWFELPRMPAGCRIGLAAAAVDNTVVAMGGALCDGDAVATVEALDMVTRTWSALPDMPGGPRRDFAAASVGTTIYAMGGMASVDGKDNVGLDRVERLEMNAAQPKWTTLKPLPGGGRYKLAAAAVTHAVVVVGGIRTDLCCQIPTPWTCANGPPPSCELSRVEEFDIATESWHVRPDRAAGVGASLAAAAIGGTVVAMGGQAGTNTALDTVEAFCFVSPEDIPLKKDDISNWLEWVTVVVTVICVLAALLMAMNRTRDLYDLADQSLDVGEDSVGLVGLGLFIASGIDLLSDVCLLITLLLIGEWMLLFCAFGASVGVAVATLQLAYATFGAVSADSNSSSADGGGADLVKDWLYSSSTSMACRNTTLAVAVIVSAVRFECLEILRLKVCGQEIVSMPIADKHYAFIQRGNLLSTCASFPHMLTAMAVLRDGGHTAHYGDTERFFIILSLVFSIVSILLAILSRIEKTRRLLHVLKSAKGSGGAVGDGSSIYSDISGSE